MTGAELRNRLGADADLVVRVSFLNPAQLRTLTGAAEADRAVPTARAPAPPDVAPPADPDDDRA